MTNKEIWVKIINDARWYDGSPHTLEKMIRHFEAQGYVVSQLLQQTPCTTHVCPKCGGMGRCEPRTLESPDGQECDCGQIA